MNLSGCHASLGSEWFRASQCRTSVQKKTNSNDFERHHCIILHNSAQLSFAYWLLRRSKRLLFNQWPGVESAKDRRFKLDLLLHIANRVVIVIILHYLVEAPSTAHFRLRFGLCRGGEATTRILADLWICDLQLILFICHCCFLLLVD